MKHSMIMIGLIALATLGAALPVPAERAPDEDNAAIKPVVTWSGPNSRITERTYLRMVKQNDLLRTWYDHLGTQPKSGGRHDPSVDPVIPEVDFDRYMVLGIFQGKECNSTGVFVDSIEETDDELIVKFDEHTYQTEAPMGQADQGDRVTPFGIFVVPRTNKPVVFVENVQGLLHAPPEWEEQFRTGWLSK
ncbi:MAG: hypothetical protein V2A76_03850 [Planctomycetota bacterium]